MTKTGAKTAAEEGSREEGHRNCRDKKWAKERGKREREKGKGEGKGSREKGNGTRGQLGTMTRSS